MLGIPLAPCHEFPSNAPAAFFSEHALADTNFPVELTAYLKTGRPVLLTDDLAHDLQGTVDLTASNAHLLAVGGDPSFLLGLSRAEVEEIRQPMLAPFHTVFHGPNHVGLYLFADNGWVVENFNGSRVDAQLNGQDMSIDGRGWKHHFE
jgi:hypothetical protein